MGDTAVVCDLICRSAIRPLFRCEATQWLRPQLSYVPQVAVNRAKSRCGSPDSQDRGAIVKTLTMVEILQQQLRNELARTNSRDRDQSIRGRPHLLPTKCADWRV